LSENHSIFSLDAFVTVYFYSLSSIISLSIDFIALLSNLNRYSLYNTILLSISFGLSNFEILSIRGDEFIAGMDIGELSTLDFPPELPR